MAKAKAVWGIDVGHCALKAVKLALAGDDQVEVLAIEYIEHGKILSQSDADPPELVAKSLEKFLSRNDLSDDGVVVAVPGQHTLARFSKLPPVDPKKIPDIVQFEANQQIPFDMDEVIWDYQAFSEDDSPEIEVGIFAMKRDLIHQHLAHFSDVGIEPIAVQSAPLGAFDAMAFDGRLSDETTVVLDIGAENSDLVITDGMRIWTRTIPIGGNNFTDGLASGFKLSFSKAEKLKRQAASSKYARQIFQALRPVFADLVSEIQRSIGFYTSTHRDAKLEVMVGLGDAFKLPGLQKFLQQNLNMKVVKPTRFKKATVSASSAEYKEHVLSLAVAYGLALEGLGVGRMTNNLLPMEIARQAIWRRKRPFFAASAACLLLAALVVQWRFSSDMSALADAPQTKSMSLEQAKQICVSGPRTPEDKPREYAAEVLAMSKALSAEYNSRQGEGKNQLEQSHDLLELLKNREFWPLLLDTIHSALPGEPAKLAGATSGADYVQRLVSGGEALARAERKQIFIEGMRSEFVGNIYAEDYRRQSEEVDLFDFYDEEGFEGFVITLECMTPHKDNAKFIETDFIPVLRKKGRESGLPFYFDGVRLIGGLNERSSSTPMARPTRAPAGRSAPVRPTTQVSRAGKPDPLTFEDTTGDWRFEVKFVVAMGEVPEEETPGTPEAEGRRGGGR